MTAFQNDWVYGNPTAGQITERMTVMKSVVERVNKAKGIKFPTGIQFVDGAASLNVAVNDRTRKSLDAIDYMKGFAEEAGVTVPKEITNAMQGLDPKFVFNFADKQINEWIGASSQLMTVSMDKAGKLAGPLGAAFDVTAALADGKVTGDEVKKIATSAGAVIGGAIGSIIPGIGTAIGTFIGSTIGALIGAIAEWISPPQPNFGDAISAQREAIASYLRKLEQACDTQEKRLLAETIFPGVTALSDYWHNVELTLGFRFPLRWFKNNPGRQFEYAAYEGRDPRNVFIQQGTYFYPPNPPTNLSYGAYKCKNDTAVKHLRVGNGTYNRYEYTGTCNFYCSQQILGCLYPDSTKFGPLRVLDALRARDFNIDSLPKCGGLVNPAEGAELAKNKAYCESKFGKGSGSGVSKISDNTARIEAQEQACVDYVWGLAKSQGAGRQQQLQAYASKFERAERLVHADLIQTANLMHAQTQLFRDKLQLMKPVVVKDAGTEVAAGMNKDKNAQQSATTKTFFFALAAGAMLLKGR